MRHVLQETVGYFFCLEDRALLCRKCDLAIHTANTFVSGHQRFLLTGVKVGLEPTEPIASSSSGKPLSGEKRSEMKSYPESRRETPIQLVGERKVSSVNVVGVQDFAAPKVSFTGGSTAGSIPQWQIDAYIGLSDYNSSFEYMGNGSSKVCFNFLFIIQSRLFYVNTYNENAGFPISNMVKFISLHKVFLMVFYNLIC